MATNQPPRRLIALDFDDTIADRNTDLVAVDLLHPGSLSAEHRKLHTDTGWLEYMQTVFKLLHEQGHQAAVIRETIAVIPEVPGMVACIRRLVEECGFEAIIISDSNSEFINHWMEAKGLTKYIKQVFTNPAAFNAEGVLIVEPHHNQTDCTLSSINLCKGRILEEFTKARQLETDGIGYAQTFYVGDGRNDVCPALRLPLATDVACARKGLRLETELGMEAVASGLKAAVISWTDGDDLGRQIALKLLPKQ